MKCDMKVNVDVDDDAKLRRVKSLETYYLHFYYMQIKGWITRIENSLRYFIFQDQSQDSVS